MQPLEEFAQSVQPVVQAAHKSLRPVQRPRFAPVNITPTGRTVTHHKLPVTSRYREVALFRGQHRDIVRASARLEARVTLRNYLREGGPV